MAIHKPLGSFHRIRYGDVAIRIKEACGTR